MKKILALLLTLGMFQIPVMAETEVADDTDKIRTLVNLDILPDTYEENYKALGNVSWKEYLTAVAGMITDDVPEDVIGFAKNYNLIKEDVSPEKEVTYDKAVQVIVRAGGYSEKVPGNNTVNAYMKTAGSRGITDGLKKSNTDRINSGDMIELLYNAIDAPVTEYEFQNNGYKVIEKDDETILSKCRDIYEYEGIVSDNGFTALDGESDVNEDFIIIDDLQMEKGDNYKIDLLGYNVRVFYKENLDECKFMYAQPVDNKVHELKGEEISSVSSDISLIGYYSGNSSKKIKVDAAVKVIYNGYVYFDYTKDDLTAENTMLTIIDNNEDSKADVILITAYENVFVKYVTEHDSKVVNSYSYEGAMNNVDISTESDDYDVKYIYNGEEIETPVINPRNVLSIATSKNSEPVRVVYISDKSFTGTLEGFTATGEYIIDGERYEGAPEFENAKNAGDVAIPEFKAGIDYIFYADINNKIVGVTSADTGALSYGVMLKLNLDEDDEKTVVIKYMDTDGTWYTEEVNNKVKLYNENYDGKNLKSDEFYKEVSKGAKIEPQVIQYAKNMDGKINLLKTAVKTTEYMPDKLTVRDSVFGCYRWTSKMFSSVNGPLLYAADEYVVFTFPAELSYDEDDYGIGSGFTTDKDFTVVPYNTDEFMTSDCFVIEGKAGGTLNEEIFIVSGFSEAVTGDGDVKKVVHGRFGTYSDISMIAKEDYIFDGLSVGDVVKFYIDGRGNVVDVESIYNVSSGYTGLMDVDYSGTAAGYVRKVDGEKKSIVIDVNGKEYVLKSTGRGSGGAVKVYLNDKEEGEAKIVNYSDILVGDYVVVSVMWAEANNIIIVRNY